MYKDIPRLLDVYAKKVAKECGEQIVKAISDLFVGGQAKPNDLQDVLHMLSILEARYRVNLSELKLFAATTD